MVWDLYTIIMIHPPEIVEQERKRQLSSLVKNMGGWFTWLKVVGKRRRWIKLIDV